MAYNKTNWVDHIVDEQGNVVQQGTALSASNFNHLETQYDEAKAYTDDKVAPLSDDLKSATLTQTLTEPINVLDSDRVTDLILKAFTGQTNVNHVPLFDSGLWNFHANVTVDSPSKITHENTSDAEEKNDINVSAKENTDYSLSLEADGSNLSVYITWFDESGTSIDSTSTLNSSGTLSMTSPTGTSTARIVLKTLNAGTYTFSNIMLNEGSTAQAFTKNVRPIKNPVLFSIGKNLIKPFTQWDLHDNATIISPYELKLNADADNQHTLFETQIVGGETYTLSGDGYIQVVVLDKDKNTIDNYNSTSMPKTIATTSDAKYLKLRATNGTKGSGTYTFTQPQLELGDTATTFQEYNESYLVLKSSFYEGDQPYQDPNGNWRKLAEKKEMALDGSLDWLFDLDDVGFKSVRYTIGSPPISQTEIVSKPSGEIVSHKAGGFTGEDQSALSSSSILYLSLSDSDTGWTDAMTPTTDQISAFFNGWIYTGDGTTHSWENYYDSADTTTDVNVCLSRNTHEENGEEGYRLVYELDTKEDVAIESEGSLQLHEGLNQIEMAEALVVREEVKDFYIDSKNQANFARTDYPETLLDYRNNNILDIYKNGEKMSKNGYVLNADSTFAQGEYFVQILSEHYDPTAQYTVTYIALPYQLSAPIDNVDVEYAQSLISVVNSLVDETTDHGRQISVNTNKNSDQDYAIDYVQAHTENVRVDFDNHESDTSNPHNVTTSQIGAATSSELSSHINDSSGAHQASAISANGSTNVQSEIDNLKSSVSSGKNQVETAITDMGGTVSDSDGDGVPTFQELDDGVRSIPKYSIEYGTFTVDSSGNASFTTPFQADVVLVYGAGINDEIRAVWGHTDLVPNFNGNTGTDQHFETFRDHEYDGDGYISSSDGQSFSFYDASDNTSWAGGNDYDYTAIKLGS